MNPLLLPILTGAVGIFLMGVAVGREWMRRTVRRALDRQIEIAAILQGEDPKNLPATEERAVIHRPVIESSHSWSEDNNGEF